MVVLIKIIYPDFLPSVYDGLNSVIWKCQVSTLPLFRLLAVTEEGNLGEDVLDALSKHNSSDSFGVTSTNYAFFK